MTRYSLFLTAICACLFLFILMIASSMMEMAVSPDPSSKFSMISFVPQGWGFFTHNPREPLVDLYAIDEKNTLTLLSKPEGSAIYLFGASRLGRRYGIELGEIIKKIRTEDWIFFRSASFQDSIPVSKQIILFADGMNNIRYLKKGKYILVSREPVPWSFLGDPRHYRNKWGLIRVTLA